MKRPGRFDLKIPFFSPQNSIERAAIVRAVLRRHRLAAELPDELLLPILDGLEGYAAADLEALVLLAYDDLQSGDLPAGVDAVPAGITAPFLARAAADFMPTRETDMVRYMELLAVHEASNRRLLPPRLRDIEVSELTAQLAEAREKLGRQKAFF
jgi:transitional endoplasmic reticulum ATPase